MIDLSSNPKFSTHEQIIKETIDMSATFSFVRPRQFEQLEPELNEEVLMPIETGEQWRWLTEHMKGLTESTPAMVSDYPGQQDTRYLNLYYKTDTPHTYVKVEFYREPGQTDLELSRVDATKICPQKELQMIEKYGVKK